MAKKRGRPVSPPGKTKGESVQIRMSDAEKLAFQTAADLSGLSLSSWVRERLRRIAMLELREAGKPVTFLGEADAPNSTAGKTKT